MLLALLHNNKSEGCLLDAFILGVTRQLVGTVYVYTVLERSSWSLLSVPHGTSFSYASRVYRYVCTYEYMCTVYSYAKTDKPNRVHAVTSTHFTVHFELLI